MSSALNAKTSLISFLQTFANTILGNQKYIGIINNMISNYCNIYNSIAKNKM